MSNMNRPALLGHVHDEATQRRIAGTYELNIHQSLAWHDEDGDGSVVRDEIRRAAAGRPIIDFSGRTLENEKPVERL